MSTAEAPTMKDDSNRHNEAHAASAEEQDHRAPGKRTLTRDMSAPVQRAAAPEGGAVVGPPARSTSDLVPISSDVSYLDSIITPPQATTSSSADRAPVQRKASRDAADAPAEHGIEARDEGNDADAARQDAMALAFTRDDDQVGGGGGGGGGGGNTQVAVEVRWRGVFGADLSGTAALQGSNDKKNWTALGTNAVADPDGIGGDKTQRMETTFQVDRYAHYQAVVKPTATDPDDRYLKTEFGPKQVAASDDALTLGGLLEVHRENRKNTDQRVEEAGLDPDKVDNLVHPALFGRTVQVNKVVEDRVKATNDLYTQQLGPVQTEIKDSLFVVGGASYRTITGKTGVLSNHAVGNAIDINYNEGKKQNALMEDKSELRLLNKLVQPVVRSVTGHAGFDIWDAKGQEQLEASRLFVERFPQFLAELLGRDDDVADLTAADSNIVVGQAFDAASWGGDSDMEQFARDLKAVEVKELFDTLSKAKITAAAKKLRKGTKRTQLEIVAEHWESLKAWLFGGKVRDKTEGKDETVFGMIPLHEKVLEMMLAAGWTWGGDWGADRKDYMHFEDRGAIDKLKL